MEKMTNVKALEFVLTTFGAEMPVDVREKLEKMQAQTAKHNASKSKGVSLVDGMAEKVIAEMETGVSYEMGDFVKMSCFAEHPKTKVAYTPNQITPVLTKMFENGMIEKSKVKGKMCYTLATACESEDQ